MPVGLGLRIPTSSPSPNPTPPTTPPSLLLPRYPQSIQPLESLQQLEQAQYFPRLPRVPYSNSQTGPRSIGISRRFRPAPSTPLPPTVYTRDHTNPLRAPPPPSPFLDEAFRHVSSVFRNRRNYKRTHPPDVHSALETDNFCRTVKGEEESDVVCGQHFTSPSRSRARVRGSVKKEMTGTAKGRGFGNGAGILDPPSSRHTPLIGTPELSGGTGTNSFSNYTSPYLEQNSTPTGNSTSTDFDKTTHIATDPLLASSIAVSVVFGLFILGLTGWAGWTCHRRRRVRQIAREGRISAFDIEHRGSTKAQGKGVGEAKDLNLSNGGGEDHYETRDRRFRSSSIMEKGLIPRSSSSSVLVSPTPILSPELESPVRDIRRKVTFVEYPYHSTETSSPSFPPSFPAFSSLGAGGRNLRGGGEQLGMSLAGEELSSSVLNEEYEYPYTYRATCESWVAEEAHTEVQGRGKDSTRYHRQDRTNILYLDSIRSQSPSQMEEEVETDEWTFCTSTPRPQTLLLPSLSTPSSGIEEELAPRHQSDSHRNRDSFDILRSSLSFNSIDEPFWTLPVPLETIQEESFTDEPTSSSDIPNPRESGTSDKSTTSTPRTISRTSVASTDSTRSRFSQISESSSTRSSILQTPRARNPNSSRCNFDSPISLPSLESLSSIDPEFISTRIGGVVGLRRSWAGMKSEMIELPDFQPRRPMTIIGNPTFTQNVNSKSKSHVNNIQSKSNTFTSPPSSTSRKTFLLAHSSPTRSATTRSTLPVNTKVRPSSSPPVSSFSQHIQNKQTIQLETFQEEPKEEDEPSEIPYYYFAGEDFKSLERFPSPPPTPVPQIHITIH